MSKFTFPREWSRETRLCVIVFGLAAVVHVCLATIGIGNTLLGPHSFRQVQTAISTFYFVQDGVTLNYITPILGPPWQIPLEFPLFQACVAWLVKMNGSDLDLTGRLVSWGFFISLLPACYLLLERFSVPRAHRLLFLSLVLLSPLYIFFSRSFLIESLALSLSAWFLVCFDRFVRRKNPAWWFGALVLGALAGSVKITTFAVFLVSAIALLIASTVAPGGISRIRVLLRGAGAVIGPIALSILWLMHATKVRHQNPESTFLDQHFGFWSFGDLEQRLSPEFWSRTFAVWSGEITSEAGILLLVLYYGLLGGRYRWVVTACLAIFLSGQLIFANLYFIHSYYFYANALFLLAALGFFFSELLLSSVAGPRARWILIAGALALQLNAYARTYYDFQSKNTPLPAAIELLKTITEPEDLLVVIGHDWDASFPYYAGRRALMIPKWNQTDFAAIIRSVARVDPKQVGAIVFSRAQWSDGEFMRQAFGALDPGPTPFLYIQDLGIWIPRHRQASIRETFDSRQFPDFILAPEINVSGQPRTLLARQIERRAEFARFKPRPVRATGLNDFTSGTVNSKEVLIAHAVTELVFSRASATRRIAASYGISDGAVSPKGSTDGVEFTITAVNADKKESVLHRRFLDPANRAEDRGPQTISVDVDVPANAEIFFRTLPGPTGNLSFDWSYWGEIALE